MQGSVVVVGRFERGEICERLLLARDNERGSIIRAVRCIGTEWLKTRETCPA